MNVKKEQFCDYCTTQDEKLWVDAIDAATTDGIATGEARSRDRIVDLERQLAEATAETKEMERRFGELLGTWTAASNREAQHLAALREVDQVLYTSRHDTHHVEGKTCRGCHAMMIARSAHGGPTPWTGK
jgi:hypothetical protein